MRSACTAYSLSRAERLFAFALPRHTVPRDPSYLPCQQFADRVVDEFGVFGLERRIAGAVPPDRRDRPQLGAWHAGHLTPVVLDRKIEIGFARHNDRVRGDRCERLAKIAVVKLV